ncbi:bifunctional folylpolyglutamate synthase/dihydrofolate synthase [Flavobacteriaceae bacterium D16]|nr:bifunctional folylpolyglutamate synthase/dihydrofolate synthase [Flavobacteriaceae bacterium D16]
MTYQETLDWLFAQLPMYQRKGQSAYSGKLDAIRELSAHLGNPHHKFRSIHVAGTNGKGSSSHMLASILQEAGYTVGLYTSPHLKDFRERIKINGRPASKQFVIGFVQRHFEYLSSRKLSFFEMTVGMAFDYFAKKKVDIAVIEVGLGGRLDSTNIIYPEVCLITNIGMDHMNLLGNTLPEIAMEKAGIIKRGVPVVIGEHHLETAPVFEEVAYVKGAPLYFAQDSVPQANYKTDLLGEYQKLNMRGVLAVLKQLKGYKISESHIQNGFSAVVKNTGLQGRWQILQESPTVICDVGHNREGLGLIMEQLSRQTYEKLHLVLGFVQEKDLQTVLPLFPKSAIYYFARPEIPRGLNAEELQQAAADHGLAGEVYSSVPQAYKAALMHSGKEDLVFVGGSTFTVAEVL